MELSRYIGGWAEKVVSPAHPFLEYSGRIGRDEEGLPEFVYPCSFVRIRFWGSGLKVVINNHRAYWDNYVGWILDGVQYKALLKSEGTTCLTLMEETEKGNHTLLLFKRQDSCHTYSLGGFLMDGEGEVLPGEGLPERRIEVYGDSVSAGEVSEAVSYVGKEDPVHQGEYSNSWYSYAWIMARTLHAQIHDIAQGGIALMSGTGWFCAPEAIGMEQVYDRIQYHPAIGRNCPWAFENYRPHVVVVAIGQNDSHPVDIMKDAYDGRRADEWRNRYEAFVRKLREIYPAAVIILTTTILKHHKNWDDAIDAVCRNLNDQRVYHFLYHNNGNGTPGHIRIPEAEEMAKELAGFIESLGDGIWK